MPLDRGAIRPGARLTERMIGDLYDLLSGEITDVDVTLGRNLIVKGALSSVGAVSQVAPGPTTVPLTLYGAPGQTANLFEIRDSSSNLLFAVNAGGSLTPVRISDWTLAQHTHASAGQGGTINVGTSAEGSYAGATAVVGVNYIVTTAISFVFCTAAVVVTLPDATTTTRPIWVVAVTGQSTVNAAAGSVFGGSINSSTGAVMNGTISAGDAITYKSDGTNWRAV